VVAGGAAIHEAAVQRSARAFVEAERKGVFGGVGEQVFGEGGEEGLGFRVGGACVSEGWGWGRPGGKYRAQAQCACAGEEFAACRLHRDSPAGLGSA